MSGEHLTSSPAGIMERWACLAGQGSLSAAPGEAFLAGLIRRWAALNRLSEEGQISVTWSAVERLISPAIKCAVAQVQQLKALVHRWEDRLHPIGEPLRMSFPLNRWLAGDREEAYSDWLAWILEEIGSAGRIGYVLCGKEVPEQILRYGQRCSVEREVWVPEGHPGHRGRLDCVVWFGDQAVILLEVKVVSAEAADRGKNAGYGQWLDSQPVPLRKAYLVATEGAARLYEWGFELLTWGEICRRLRRLIPEFVTEGRLILAALVGGFVGTVEQNLLGVPSLAWLGEDEDSGTALVLRSQVTAATTYLNQCCDGRVQQ